MRSRKASFLCTVFVAVAAGSSMGQDPLDDMYGQAVHSYYRGDTMRAEQLLDEVIAAGSLDPRAHFFRGLCQVRTSGSVEAGLGEFERGAQLEMEGKKVVNVGKALERIQGLARLEIEKARGKARLASRARLLEIQRARYEDAQRNPANVGGGIVVPPRAGQPAPVPAPVPANDPFAQDSGMTKGTPEPMAETVAPEAPAEESENVFGDDAPMEPAADAPATGDDPFGN